MQTIFNPIVMSVFELLKAGPGPSSSHTIGPMRAGADFAALAATLDAGLLARARGVRVRLLGSLSATGQGHGTDRAVLAGLMGYEPAACPPSVLSTLLALPKEERVLRIQGKALPLGAAIIDYGPVRHGYPYSNTLFIDLLDIPYGEEDVPPGRGGADPAALSAPGACGCGRACALQEGDAAGAAGPAAPDAADPLAGHVLFSREYYSVGGGFLQWKGWQPEERGRPAHPYGNMRQLQERLGATGLSLDALLLENETAITGAAPGTIHQGLDALLDMMKDSVRRGCAGRGVLPGPLGLLRKAGVLYGRAGSLQPFDRGLCLLNAYAYGVAEENAAGHTIVTAPTCGAAGVVPAVLMGMQEELGLDAAAQRKGLLAAAALGCIAKQNAGIAGAEVGCQGEVGVASAMAAGMLAQARGYSPVVVENAAEIAMEHHLGLTCDPVGGYVQIPCIERNAMGAVKAYNAALIACNENPGAHLVGYDDALCAMAQIGRDMSAKYKETSTGGLAVCLAVC